MANALYYFKYENNKIIALMIDIFIISFHELYIFQRPKPFFYLSSYNTNADVY